MSNTWSTMLSMPAGASEWPCAVHTADGARGRAQHGSDLRRRYGRALHRTACQRSFAARRLCIYCTDLLHTTTAALLWATPSACCRQSLCRQHRHVFVVTGGRHSLLFTPFMQVGLLPPGALDAFRVLLGGLYLPLAVAQLGDSAGARGGGGASQSVLQVCRTPVVRLIRLICFFDEFHTKNSTCRVDCSLLG